MAASSPQDLQLSPSGRLLIPTAQPAAAGEDVFISLDETVVKVNHLLDEAMKAKERVVFIRAPVASGKTTLANYLTSMHSDKFVAVFAATSDDMWYQHVIDASGENLPLSAVRKALIAIASQGKTIVIDEAHLLFAHPNVLFHFIKSCTASAKPFIK